MILRAKFHVVLSLLTVLKIIFYLAIVKVPVGLPLKMSLTPKRKCSKSKKCLFCHVNFPNVPDEIKVE